MIQFKSGRFFGASFMIIFAIILVYAFFNMQDEKKYNKAKELMETTFGIITLLVGGVTISGTTKKVMEKINPQNISPIPSINKVNGASSKNIILKIYKKHLEVATKKRSGIIMKAVKFLVAHDTDWINADAMKIYYDWKKQINIKHGGTHLIVDDVRVLEVIPAITTEIKEKAWHVIYDTEKDNEKFGDDANDIAIGVELCIFSDKNRSKRAYINYVRLFAYLCKKFSIDPRTKITGHENLQDNKRDPSFAFGRIDKDFSMFIQDIENEMKNNIEVQIEQA